MQHQEHYKSVISACEIRISVLKSELNENEEDMNNYIKKKSSLSKQRSLLLAKDVENKVTTNTTNQWANYQSLQSVLRATEAQLKAAPGRRNTSKLTQEQ